MCGRFAFFATEDDIEELLPGIHVNYWPAPRYNIAPSTEILAVLNDGRHETSSTRWGLVPSWAKDPALGNRMINARLETLAQKPSFRKPFARQRCVIPASGFYEWKKTGAGKEPYFIRLRSGKPMAFAGLYDRWRSADGAVLVTSTIITTAANDAILPVHERMPLMLRRENIDGWLATEESTPAELEKLLCAVDPGEIDTVPVSTMVNDPSREGSACVQPIK